MTDEWVNTISKRYIELYEQVIGDKFQPAILSQEETVSRIESALKNLS
jgi:phosphoribosylaminoimidazole-succinocarboxamide synthase